MLGLTSAKVYAVGIAIGTLVWWVFLLFVPEIKALFLWPGMPETVLLAFLPADLIFFVIAPLVYAVKPKTSVWNFHRFGVHYASVACLTLCLVTQGGYLGGILMLVASIGAEVVACQIPLPTRPIEAKPASVGANIAKTLSQTAVMWLVFLVLIPIAVLQAERLVGVPPLPKLPLLPLIVLFWAAGLSGIHSGILFALHGQGTPLPLDTTTRFVVLGLYRYIRNPMAVLGIFQGVLVGLMVQSAAVVAYALLGIVAWHGFARPWEERDLRDRFGQAYIDYAKAVHNWIPRFTPYPKIVFDKISPQPEDLLSMDESHSRRTEIHGETPRLEP